MNNAIIDKVRAILDRANHPNTPQAEAETALAMAQRLMMKHGLDEAVFANAQQTDVEIVSDRIIITGAWALNRVRLAYAIAKANSVASYRNTAWSGNSKQLSLVMYGTKADIFTVKTLFASAELLATRVIPKGSRSFKHAWWMGFVSGVTNVLTKSKNDFIQEQGVGAGLVLADKYKRADGEMRAKVSLRTTKSTYSNGNGYGAGYSAGSSFRGGGLGGSAIGALGR